MMPQRMMPNGQQQDPLLSADANDIIQGLSQAKAALELELLTRDSIISKLYNRVKELELENNLLRSDKEKAEA